MRTHGHAALSATVALVVRGVRAVGTCDSLSGPLMGFLVRHTADWDVEGTMVSLNVGVPDDLQSG